MKESGVSQLPVTTAGELVGIVTESDLLAKLVDGHAGLESAVAEVMFRKVVTVTADQDASVLSELFARELVALVVDAAGTLQGVLSKIDLVDYLTQHPDETVP